MITVYKITNTVNGMGYVGVTGRSVTARWAQHVSQRNRLATALSRAINKYGPSKFICIKLAETTDNISAYLLERQMIIEHATLTPNGYNLTTGGERIAGGAVSEEVRAKMRKSQRGRVHTEETKAKIRASNMGHTRNKGKKRKACSSETKANIGAANRGRVRTEQARINMSLAQLGRKLSEDAKRKVSESKIGKPRPPHVKSALLAASVGRVPSDETRKKLSAAKKGKPHSAQHLANWRASIARRKQLKQEARL
jgi:group I intron endonuclease